MYSVFSEITLNIVDIMKTDISYATKKLISWKLTFENINRVFNLYSLLHRLTMRAQLCGAREISARKQRSMYLREGEEAQMKLDAARRIKRRRGYHKIGYLYYLELTQRYAAKWLLPRRRSFSRGARDWSARPMRFDNNNDNDGDDEVNNNKERLRRAQDA